MTKPILVVRIPHDTDDRAFRALQAAIKNVNIESQYFVFIIKLLSVKEITFEVYGIKKDVKDVDMDQLIEVLKLEK